MKGYSQLDLALCAEALNLWNKANSGNGNLWKIASHRGKEFNALAKTLTARKDADDRGERPQPEHLVVRHVKPHGMTHDISCCHYCIQIVERLAHPLKEREQEAEGG